MSLIDVKCTLQYQVMGVTNFLFNIAVSPTSSQKIESESFTMTPRKDASFVSVGEKGNRVLRLQVDRCDFTLEYAARVNLEPQLDNPGQIDEVDFHRLPEEVLPYLNPSRYCESDRLARLALREFGEVPQGHQRVQAICDWTNRHLEYLSGSTDARSSACDVLVQSTGVCRDYAHLAISLCRGICIPARYVSGYAVGLEPPDFHGFFEAYLDGGWYLFDATRMAPRNGLVRIGVGRDASDVSFATIIGNAYLQKMEVSAREVTNDIDPDQETAHAVSTA